MSNYVIETDGLRKKFKKTDVLSGISLQMEQNQILALLGPNGVGKTTLIRILLDMLQSDGGQSYVFGLKSNKNGTAIRAQVGYVAERPRMIEWMSISQIMKFVQGFYATWDHSYALDLMKRLNLSPSSRIRQLSRGQEAKLALLLALAHRPKLIILDDALSGIDPAARKDIFSGLISHIETSETSIFMTTHSINEIEGFADQLAILKDGRILANESIEKLKQHFKKIIVWHHNSLPKPLSNLKIHSTHEHQQYTVYITDCYEPAYRDEWVAAGNIEIVDMPLEEIYLSIAH